MYVIKGSVAQLECLYDLDGEALYSVKWYKDGNEFYRYVPRDMPPAQTFLLPGVNVDVSIPIYIYPFITKAKEQSLVRVGVALKLNIKTTLHTFVVPAETTMPCAGFSLFFLHGKKHVFLKNLLYSILKGL